MTGRHAAEVSPLAMLDQIEADNLRRRALSLYDQWQAWAYGTEAMDVASWAGTAAVLLRELAASPHPKGDEDR
jgi:hypothetical protein